MVTVVKPTSLQQQTPYRSLSPIRSQRLPSHRFTLPTPAMGPPASPHHNFIEQQSFLHAELNSRFLASTHPPQRHPNYHPGGLPGYENPRAYGSILNFGAFQPKPSSG
uniref:Uncharacterized protein n=1 Tax=Ciona savignyi TaxID=51511 RepID=H2YK62_CIOSA